MLDDTRLDQKQRPLYDYIRHHSECDTVRYHVPGHIGGKLFTDSNWQALGKWDVTETYDMDDLHSPRTIIKDAEQLAAAAFGAKRTYFLVNGTSGGLLAAIHGLFQTGDTVLVQRNAHKSVYNGLMLLGLSVRYIMPEMMNSGNIAGAITADILAKQLQTTANVKGVIITSPTFYGHAADIEQISDICKQYNVILLVDEAHGAHYPFHPILRARSAILQGADVVVNSIHKTLPAFTMGSMLHVSEAALDRIDTERLDYYVSLFQTTSPSYLIMSSLDYARHWMVHHGEQALQKAFARKQLLSEQLNKLGLTVLDSLWEKHEHATDPLKITLSVRATGMNGNEWEQELAKDQIYIELVSTDHLLLVLGLEVQAGQIGHSREIVTEQLAMQSIEITKEDRRLLRSIGRIKALADANSDANNDTSNARQTHSQQAAIQQVQIEPIGNVQTVFPFSDISQEIRKCAMRQIPLEVCDGQVVAEFVVPYPPGIPILCPGERVSAEHIAYIKNAKAANIHFQGIADKQIQTLKCFDIKKM